MRRFITLGLAALLVLALAVPAIARPSNKGTTYVAPSATTASVLVDVTSPSELTNLGAAFGIVGKAFPKSDVIKHVGGLEIRTTLGVVEIRNFWIDTTAGTVSAYVPALDVRVDLFDLADVEVTDAGDITATLLFNATADSVIVGDAADIVGASAGTALIDLP